MTNPSCDGAESLREKVSGLLEKAKAIGRWGSDTVDWESLPESIDLRPEFEQLGVNFIQQGPRNSCAAFATASVLELQLRRLGCNVDLSEQYVLWAAKDMGANPTKGVSIKHLREGLEKHGICREELMPYRSGEEIDAPSFRAKEDAAKMPKVRLKSVVPFDGAFGFDNQEIFTVCKALSRHEPVCFASQWSGSEKPLDRGTVLDEGPMSGNHMVILVGYELDPEDPSNGHFLLRNSWGLIWGDLGYAKLPFSYVRKHAIDAVEFQFVWNEDKATANSTGANESQRAPGAVSFALLWLSVTVVIAFLGFYLSSRFFARENGSFRGVLKYLLRISPLFAVSALAVSWAAMAIANGSELTTIVIALVVCMLVLYVFYFRITMKHFEIGFWRCVGLLLVAGLIRSGFGWLETRFMPFDWYPAWERVFAMTPIQERPFLFGMNAEEQARVLASQTPEWAPDGWGAEQNAAWLEQWWDDLKSEQSHMQNGLPLAQPLYARRVAAYKAQRLAFERRDRNGNDAGSPIVSQPAESGERQQLWKMYEALRAEREKLDWSDPVAVKQFNERAQQYERRKQAIERERSAPSA